MKILNKDRFRSATWN